MAVTTDELPIAAAYQWAVMDRCGAVVLFSGTVRDHAVDVDGVMRTDVQHLHYEAYDHQVVPSFDKIVAEVRTRWPHTGRVALLHRLGRLELGDSSVIAVVSAPHRPEAFEAARFAIDALKASAPIWKRETWSSGGASPVVDGSSQSAWGTNAHDLIDPSIVASPQPSPAAATATGRT